jgi:hypothetical protein
MKHAYLIWENGDGGYYIEYPLSDFLRKNDSTYNFLVKEFGIPKGVIK